MNTDREEQDAYITWWLKSYPFRAADKEIEPFCDLKFEKHRNCLKTAREALFLSTNEMAERLGISRAAYSRLENAEPAGAPSLKSLSRAAEVMGCELIYTIRPKTGQKFSEVIWAKLKRAVLRNAMLRSPNKKQLPRVLAGRARLKQEDGEFRQKQAWTERYKMLGYGHGSDRF